VSAQAASVTPAIPPQKPLRKLHLWQVAYTAAAACAGAAIALHLLLASQINAIAVVMLVGLALAIVPVAVAHGSGRTQQIAQYVLLAHQIVLAMALYAVVPADLHLLVLPAFAGSMALAAQIGRAALFAGASAMVAWVLIQSAGLASVQADSLGAGWFGVAEVAVISALLALPGLATYWHSARANQMRKSAADAAETEPRPVAERILDCLPQLVLRHNRAGNVTAVYGSAAATPLARRDALLGGGLFARVHVADRPALLHALDRARHHPGIHRAEIRLCEPVSEVEPQSPSQPPHAPAYRWMELRAKSDAGHDCGDAEPVVCSTLRDIHDHKAREEALELARREAELGNASKTRFLASVSHELRTPLNAVIGFSELLKLPQSEYEPMSDEKRIEYATLISDSGLHLLEVVNDILDATKIEAGRFEIQCESVDLRPIVRSAAEMIEARAAADQNRIDVRIDKDLPQIVADGRALKQILLNLLSNAVKFSPGAPPVKVHVKRDADHVVLSVVDEGIGIGADDLSRIGEPFFRAAEAESLQTAGTGLGMSVVKGLVALHGGQITVASACGEGTHVAVRLPIAGPSGPEDEMGRLDETITTLPLRPAVSTVAEAAEHELKKVG
jgi:cell cycle sensor histidine kinase DivJ